MSNGVVWINISDNHQVYIADLVMAVDSDAIAISDTMDEGDFWQTVSMLDLDVVELYS